MKYYEELLKLVVFTVDDLAEMTGNKKTALSVISRLSQKGYVKKIRNNFYYCVNLENKESATNRYIIASNINDTCYISHHSAFEYYGLAGQIFYDMYVSSEKYFTKFEFENINYKYIKSYTKKGIVVPETDNKVKITDLERTVIDCIKDIDLAGGTEELFQCLDSVSNLNNEKLIEYLVEYSQQYLYQKAGFIFEVFKESFNISDDLIFECQKKVKKRVCYFDNDTKEYGGKYFKKWQLIVPKSIEVFYNQGVSELV